MTTKFLVLPALFVLSFCLNSCEENQECDIRPTACEDTPPTNQLCQAYFVSWFYNESTNECEQIGYSACSESGFTTQAECELCDCN